MKLRITNYELRMENIEFIFSHGVHGGHGEIHDNTPKSPEKGDLNVSLFIAH